MMAWELGSVLDAPHSLLNMATSKCIKKLDDALSETQKSRQPPSLFKKAGRLPDGVASPGIEPESPP